MSINQQEVFFSGDEVMDIVPLSTCQEKLYRDAVYGTPIGGVSVFGGKNLNRESLARMRVYTSDIKSSHDLWVDDDVVNTFGELIQKRSESNALLPKVVCLNSNFWPMLKKKYSSVECWESKVWLPILTSRLIFLSSTIYCFRCF
jgi:hypothetical protein